MPGTRKLGRKTDHRMAMLKGMATYLLEYGKIETTVTRAKEVSALTDKMVTLGKANTLASRRQAMAFLKKESEKARQSVTTPNCRQACSGCGAACWKGGVCVENR